MKSKVIRSLSLAAALFLAGSLAAAEPPAPEAALFPKLISAVEQGDFEAVIAQGDEQFKAMPKERFDGAVAFLAPKLKAGYDIVFLGELKQRGTRVTLWKIVFKDGSDDVLGSLVMKDGKIAGFIVR